jgi:hypothetical protein
MIGRVCFILLALLIACGTDAMTSHVLMDAGELARDAAQLLDAAADAMGDAGRQLGDAAAQAGAETYDVACTTEYHYTQTTGSSVVDSWQYFAELDLDTGTITGVDVRSCGREVLGNTDSALSPCGAGSTCTGQQQPAPTPCITGASAVQLEPRKARVACGQRQRYTQGGVVTSDTGQRYATVKLTVRR